MLAAEIMEIEFSFLHFKIFNSCFYFFTNEIYSVRLYLFGGLIR